MNLYKVKIKNFKTMRDFEIDFRSNTNGLEKDIVLRKFKKILNGGYGLPGIVAILGRNGIGKTTMIDAITFCFDLFNGHIADSIMTLVVKSELQKEIQKRSLQSKMTENREILEIEKKLITEIQGQKGIIYQTFQLEVAKFFKYYHQKFANNNTAPIHFELFFDNDGIEEVFTLSIEEDGNARDNLVNNDDFREKFTSFSSCFLAPDRHYRGYDSLINIFNTKNIANFHNSISGIPGAIASLMNYITKEKTIEIIKLADPLISDLVTSTTYSGLTMINEVICDGRSIAVNELSGGTKAFIGLAEGIVRAYNNADKHKQGLLIIDEIEIKLHKELVLSLLRMMGKVFSNQNMQFIVTSHNPSFLSDYLSNKQIFSIEKDGRNHSVIKASKIMKQHENLMTKYNKGLIVGYPDTELSRNTIANIFDE